MKSAADAGQEAAEWTRSITGTLGIEGNHRYLYAAAFFDLLAKVAGRITKDPPRKDFTTSTHVRSRFAKPTYIETEIPFERLALEAAAAADDAEAHLAAHLRAFERFQGAFNADRKPEADQRAVEARKHAQMGSRALRRLANPVDSIAESFVEFKRMESRSGRPRIGEVDKETLAILFLGGLRVRDLENVLRESASTMQTLPPNTSSQPPRAFASSARRWSTGSRQRNRILCSDLATGAAGRDPAVMQNGALAAEQHRTLSTQSPGPKTWQIQPGFRSAVIPRSA